MKLDEFIKEMENDLQKFKDHWEKKNKELGSKIYPMELDSSDWYQQFISFEDMENQEF